jgi:hypothetical protein
MGPRHPGPKQNRGAHQRREDNLASAIFVGARRGDDGRDQLDFPNTRSKIVSTCCR